ncbi:Ni/Fe hydrogenase [Acidihalobacter aeolianus]|uniref:hydrogenase (acceptor) n=1 Tax=Acidihalobacter aeolianus TaxID=2792603 RepID=A0A1D8K6H7_9GAMM|nr:hydrogenase small subunit [Acidihalobacter aeolianus]AOV16563.1 Ni/Fe hydrogenase [Acidihalobacter aeolianus]
MDADDKNTIGDYLRSQGISRRAFLKLCAAMASALALPPGAALAMAETLPQKRRPSVIYMSYQECTGCLESLTRSFTPTLEYLMFNVMSLDYDDTLQAAAGFQAEAAREAAMKANWGKYLMIVDGAIPDGNNGYCTAAGKSALQSIQDVAKGAAAVVAVGTCASFGGLPMANPNPTRATMVSDIVTDKPVINVPGCPPIPVVITGTLAHFLTFGRLPDLDHLKRPIAFYGNTIHDRCYRRPFYDRGEFAKTFDDEGARNGWCLYELGCKGPTTYNACATTKWNAGTSFPIESGHGCIGCSEPNFWDRGDLYKPLSAGLWHGSIGADLGAAAVAGIAIGGLAAATARHRQSKITEKK